MARDLKFRIKEVEGLYYRCSENKDADQLRGYREADLRLCFRICKNPVFHIAAQFVPDLVRYPEDRDRFSRGGGSNESFHCFSVCSCVEAVGDDVSVLTNSSIENLKKTDRCLRVLENVSLLLVGQVHQSTVLAILCVLFKAFS